MPNFRLTGDAKGAVQAVRDFNKELAKTEKTGDAAEKSTKRLDKAAERLKERVEPQRRYNRQLQELAQHVKDGRISIEQAEKAATIYGRQLERAGKSGERTFGGAALARIGKFAAAYFSISQAVSAVASAIRSADQAGKDAAAGAQESLSQIGALQQLSDAPGDLAFARELVGAGVAPTVGAAADLVFNLRSSGLSEQEKRFIALRVGRSGAVPSADLPGLTTNVKKAQQQLRLGSLEESFQKLLATSEVTDTDLTSVARASTQFGSELGALDFKGEAGLAGLAAVLQGAPNVETAATRLRAFLSAVDKRGLSAGTLVGTVEAIEGRVAGGEDINDILGEQRAITGFRNLAGALGFVRQQTGVIGRAPADDLIGQRFGQLERVDPVFAAAKSREISRGRLLLSREPLSVRENLFQNLQDELEAIRRNAGQSEIGNFLQRNIFGGVPDFLGTEETALRSALVQSERGQLPGGARLSDDLTQKIIGLIERTAEATENMDRKQVTTRAE